MKSKVDIVEFAEAICNMKLLDCQKSFLRKVYECRKNNKLLPIFGRGSASMRFLGAEMMCILYDDFITKQESEG